MGAYTLRFKFIGPDDPQDPGMKAILQDILDANSEVDPLMMVQRFQMIFDRGVRPMMLMDQIRPTTVTLEFEGVYHRVRRDRKKR